MVEQCVWIFRSAFAKTIINEKICNEFIMCNICRTVFYGFASTRKLEEKNFDLIAIVWLLVISQEMQQFLEHIWTWGPKKYIKYKRRGSSAQR